MIVLDVFVAAMVKLQQFVINELEKVSINARQLFSKSASTSCDSQFVLAAHYDVSIISRLVKNI